MAEFQPCKVGVSQGSPIDLAICPCARGNKSAGEPKVFAKA